MSQKKKITTIDTGEAHRVVEERCSTVDRDAELTTSDLLNHLSTYDSDISDHQLIYTWKRAGIITPRTGKKVTRDVDLYSHEQVRRATMAAYLWKKGVPPSEITGAVAFWPDSVLKETRQFTVFFAEWDRAWLWLASRLLAVITGLATGFDGPPSDSILICRPVSKADLERPGHEGLTLCARESAPQLIPERMLIGYASRRPEAEVIARIKDFHDIIPKMVGRKYYGIQVNYSKDLNHPPYEIDIGIPNNPTDTRARNLIRAQSLGILPGKVTPRSQELLYCVLNYIFSALIMMPSQLAGDDPRYRLPPGADHLEALTTAIVMANPAWSSCAFLVRDKNDILRLRSHSPEYPARQGLSLALNPQRNLESWVYLTGDYVVVMEDMKERDPRIPEAGRHIGASPFALVPALSDRGVEGVVYVSAEPSRNTDERCFESEMDLLHMLAGILGEAHARQSMTDVGHLLHAPPPFQAEYPREVDLRRTLEDLLREHVVCGLHDEAFTNENVVLFAVQVDAGGDPAVKGWYDKQLCRRLVYFLESHVRSHRFSVSENIEVYRLDRGALVGLVKSMPRDPNFPGLRKRFQEHIREFSDAYQAVDAHLWSVQFSYPVLRRQLLEHRPVESSDIEARVQAILDHVHRALRNVRLLSEADNHLREGNFEKALPLYKMALTEDDSYALRHLSEVYAGLGQWTLAREYAEEAIAADRRMKLPGYAGSHICLARALVGLGHHYEGLQEYEKAAKMSQEPRYQLAFARALIGYGSDDQIQEAIEILNDLLRRHDVTDTQKSWGCFLRAKAEIKLDNKMQASEALKMALEFDRDNSYASWELEQQQIAESRTGSIYETNV